MFLGKSTANLSRLDMICLLSILIFTAIVFLPPVYVLSYAGGAKLVLNESSKIALINSFIISAAVTAVDVILGLPVAWMMARRKDLKYRYIIDTLIDMPLVVPTSVLGLSVFYFWGAGMGSLFGLDEGLLSKGPIMLALLHIVFTFPYIVRSIEAAISQINISHEQAATMLGAPPLTVFRTVSLPLFKSGLIAGAILVFTRSLSETGATMMVAGLFSTASTIVVDYKKAQDIPSAAAVSIVLIAVAVLLLISAKILSGGFRIPVIHVWPQTERKLSRRYVPYRDALISFLVILIVLLPTFYIVLSGLNVIRSQTIIELIRNQALMESLIISFIIGLVATGINLVLAIPLAYVISKNMFKAGGIVDTMSDIILLVPTSALGLSLSLFWKNFAFPELLILVLAHLSFTFPLMVKPISAALAGVETGIEDAACTLGANKVTIFKTITYPLIKPAIIAGIIMTFMRSLSETGATLSVSENIKTIPVLLVDIFTKGMVDDKTILACIVLFAASFAFIVALKIVESKKNAKH